MHMKKAGKANENSSLPDFSQHRFKHPKFRDARNKAKKLNAVSQERKGIHKTRMLIFL